MNKIAAAALGSLILAAGLQSPEAAELRWVGCSVANKGFMETLAAAYESRTGITIVIDEVGATRGIREVAAGRADLGGSCRHKIMADEERNVRLIPVGWDALVAIVHPTNPVKSISRENLKAVFAGQITNWSELGGSDAPITVVVRESKISGVGLTIREMLFADPDYDFADWAVREDSNSLVEEWIERDPDTIAFTGLSSGRKRNVEVLSIDGSAPTHGNIVNGLYGLVRPLYLVVSKKPSDDVMAFAHYATSAEGQEILKQSGTVNLGGGKGIWTRYRKILSEARKKSGS